MTFCEDTSKNIISFRKFKMLATTTDLGLVKKSNIDCRLYIQGKISYLAESVWN